MDKVKFTCKNCGNELNSSLEICGNCGITRAGVSNWEKHNPTYRLVLHDTILFEGYIHQCCKYMEDNDIASARILKENSFFKGKPFIPKAKNIKNYKNAIKYNGTKAILLSAGSI